MKKLTFLSMLMTLLLLGCTKDNIQVDPKQDPVLEARNGNGKQVTKPFKTTVSVSVEALAKGEFVGFCEGQFGNFNIVNNNPGGTKTEMTHLGRVSTTFAEACVRPFLLDDPEVFPPEVYGPFLAALELFPIPGVATQEDVYTAANGKDQLYIRSTFNTFPSPDNKFRGHLEGTFEITGGTGKFEGATGGGTLTGSASADFINPTYPYIRKYDGEITY